MPTPAELLAQSKAAFREANRVDGKRASYRMDSPGEFVSVMAYLDGGPRPNLQLSLMGLGLVLEEDARRALVVVEPPPPPPPATTHMLPGSRVTLDSGEVAAWNVFDSPTTQMTGQPGEWGRIIAWDPTDYSTRAEDTGPGIYRPPNRCYTLHGFKLVEGCPGRLYDFHASPFSGAGWGGVAPLAIDYFGNSRGLHIVAESEDSTPQDAGGGRYHFTIASQAEIEARRNQWVWGWMEEVWGRSNGPADGSLRFWLAGEDTPRVNVSGINTYWPSMRHVTFWEGAYWSGNGAPGKVVVELAATRVGRTPRECFEDVPRVLKRYGAGERPGVTVAIGDVDGGSVPVPASLRW